MMNEPKTMQPGVSEDDPVYFCFSAALRIFGEHLDIDEISRTLGIQPTHSHRKGERRNNMAPPWPHDMWSFMPPIEEDRPLDEHILAVWSAVRSNIPYLRALKEKFDVDVFCTYRTNSETAGFEVGHECLGLFAELEIPFGVSVIIA